MSEDTHEGTIQPMFGFNLVPAQMSGYVVNNAQMYDGRPTVTYFAGELDDCLDFIREQYDPTPELTVEEMRDASTFVDIPESSYDKIREALDRHTEEAVKKLFGIVDSPINHPGSIHVGKVYPEPKPWVSYEVVGSFVEEPLNTDDEHVGSDNGEVPFRFVRAGPIKPGETIVMHVGKHDEEPAPKKYSYFATTSGGSDNLPWTVRRLFEQNTVCYCANSSQAEFIAKALNFANNGGLAGSEEN